MKKLNILKTVLDIFFFFALLGIVAMTVFVPMLLLDGKDIAIKIKGEEMFIDNWPARIVMLCAFASGLLFVYAIFLFRKNVIFFVKRDIFSPAVILNFDRIGWCLIASTLLSGIPLFIYEAVNRKHTGIQFGVGGFDSMLLSIALGLFFMVLSQVFKIGKNLKEENDLTL